MYQHSVIITENATINASSTSMGGVRNESCSKCIAGEKILPQPLAWNNPALSAVTMINNFSEVCKSWH